MLLLIDRVATALWPKSFTASNTLPMHACTYTEIHGSKNKFGGLGGMRVEMKSCHLRPDSENRQCVVDVMHEKQRYDGFLS